MIPKSRRSLPARKPLEPRDAGYVLLRLPLEVRNLFAEWLRLHYPDKLNHVLSLLRSAREGKLYDPRFGARMTGSGPYAGMIRRRFEAAAARLGLNQSRVPLRTNCFRPPARTGRTITIVLRQQATSSEADRAKHVALCLIWLPSGCIAFIRFMKGRHHEMRRRRPGDNQCHANITKVALQINAQAFSLANSFLTEVGHEFRLKRNCWIR